MKKKKKERKLEYKNDLSMIAAIMGKKGGTHNKQNHDLDYFRKLGRIAAAKRWGKTTDITFEMP